MPGEGPSAPVLGKALVLSASLVVGLPVIFPCVAPAAVNAFAEFVVMLGGLMTDVAPPLLVAAPPVVAPPLLDPPPLVELLVLLLDAPLLPVQRRLMFLVDSLDDLHHRVFHQFVIARGLQRN